MKLIERVEKLLPSAQETIDSIAKPVSFQKITMVSITGLALSTKKENWTEKRTL